MIILILLILSAGLFSGLFIFLGPAAMNLYANSHFFQFDETFVLFDVAYENIVYKTVIAIFLAFNTLVVNLLYIFVNNAYTRIVIMQHNGNLERQDALQMFILASCADAIRLLQGFTAVLGRTSNVTFLTSVLSSDFASSLFSRYTGLYHPELYHFGHPIHFWPANKVVPGVFKNPTHDHDEQFNPSSINSRILRIAHTINHSNGYRYHPAFTDLYH